MLGRSRRADAISIGGHRLVAAGHPDEAVEALGEHDRLDRVAADLAADERAAHALVAHRDAVGHRDRAELERHAAGLADARRGRPRRATRSVMLHGVISFHELAMPTCGFTQSSSVSPIARSIARAAAFGLPSVTSRERGLMSTGCSALMARRVVTPSPPQPGGRATRGRTFGSGRWSTTCIGVRPVPRAAAAPPCGREELWKAAAGRAGGDGFPATGRGSSPRFRDDPPRPERRSRPVRRGAPTEPSTAPAPPRPGLFTTWRHRGRGISRSTVQAVAHNPWCDGLHRELSVLLTSFTDDDVSQLGVQVPEVVLDVRGLRTRLRNSPRGRRSRQRGVVPHRARRDRRAGRRIGLGQERHGPVHPRPAASRPGASPPARSSSTGASSSGSPSASCGRSAAARSR